MLPEQVNVLKSSEPEEPQINITVTGYGPYRKQENIFISTNLGTYPITFRFNPYYANWSHALDELIVEDSNYMFSARTIRVLRRLRRALSIGISRRKHSAGISNGFKATIKVSNKVTFLKFLGTANCSVHVSRMASRSGFVVNDYSREMERVVRRGSGADEFYVSSVSFSIDPDFVGSDINVFPNLIPAISAFEIQSLVLEPLLVSNKDSTAVNKFVRLQKVFVTPQGIIGKQVSESSIEVVNPSVSDYWPSPLWMNPSTSHYLSPNVEGCIKVTESASYMDCSDNWAHFVEDNLPSILGLIEQDQLRSVFLSGGISSVQKEALQELFPETLFVEMKRGYKYEFEDVIINVHTDSRNDKILGLESTQDMLDFENMRKIMSRATLLIQDEAQNRIKVFISRNGGFRPLINRAKIESIFKENGYLIVSAETLGFIERIRLFQRASIVAGETGAGLVNLYFCNEGTSVIELRHPYVRDSKEHEALLRLTNHQYRIVYGRPVSSMKKLLFGVDSYDLDEHEVSSVLRS